MSVEPGRGSTYPARMFRSGSRGLLLAAVLCAELACGGTAVIDFEPADGGGGGTGGTAGTGGTGATGGTAGTGGTGGTAGTGGTGGTAGSVPGTCPSAPNLGPMVKVASPQATATCIDAYEVTRGQYAAWLATAPPPPPGPPFCSWNASFEPQIGSWPPSPEEEELPIVGVDWCDAQAYCRRHGRRLCGRIVPPGQPVPTNAFDDYFESEWYNACTERGAHTFPYGGTYQAYTCNGEEVDLAEPWSVGTGGACTTWDGVYDLSGNVWEWENSCSGNSGATDECRIRGGAFNAGESLLACAADLLQQRDLQHPTVGFRCCADPLP